MIRIFKENIYNIDFGTQAFKLLWEKEKCIEIDKLKKLMKLIPEIKEKLVSSVPDAITYYEWILKFGITIKLLT